jgi:alpha-L-rhamnosidase
MNKVKPIILITLLVWMAVPGALHAKQSVKTGVVRLRTEYRVNPMGLGTPSPRFSWEIVSEERNTVQTAFRIRAASTIKEVVTGKNLLWDTGKKNDDQSVHIPYAGKLPGSGESVYWQVRVWDNHGLSSGWSESAFFETGILNREEWKARWIESDAKGADGCFLPNPHFRREFFLREKIREARIYVTCHGLYELSVNGEKVGDQVFTPGWTSYPHRLQYQVYDVSDLLKPGLNAIGAILGNGWYVGPFGFNWRKDVYGDKVALLLQMKVKYTSGKEETFITDRSWRSSSGPILLSEIYNGEIYDARKELEGWSLPGFNDAAWTPCREAEYGYDNLVASEGDEVRIVRSLQPVRKIITPSGETVLDMGQNMVGWVHFRLRGIPGTTITLHHAEALDKQGNFYTENLRPAKQEIRYTFKSSDAEEFEPHFTFMGFRYIRITGYDGDLDPSGFTGKVISSDMTHTGKFVCSDSLINRLQENIVWGLTGNFLDVPTDCPQRDERLGWTGDAQVFAPTACFNRNTAPFFTKWLKDLAADQKADGSVPWVVPNIIINGGGTGWSDGFGSTGWGDAAVVIPWTVYQFYGDKRILEEQYPSMKAWVDYMIRESGEDHILNSGFHFGDWLSFAEYSSYNYNAPDYGYAGANTDKDLLATAYCYFSAGLLQKAASLLGKPDDAAYLEGVRSKIREAFQQEFMTSTGRLSSNTQTAYSLALSFGLLPDHLKDAAAKRLAGDVTYFGHLTTGFLGTPLILSALSDNGYPGLAYMLLFNTRYPSWLYPVTMGATTIWERWDGMRPDSTFQDAGMNSFNHYAYGAVGNWLYSRVAGLATDPEKPGFKNVIIRPEFTGKLDYAGAEFHSMYGKTEAGWERKNGSILMNVTIPANATAEIHFPVDDAERITESGIPVNRNNGVVVKGIAGGRLVIGIGSGKYLFIFSE